MDAEFDVVVIGSGPGGYVAAIRAAQLGLKTACIEKDKDLGGTCLNVGCIPSKALLHSTEYYDWILKKAQENGLIVEGTKVDFSKMMTRKREIVKSHVDGIDGLFKKNKVERILGTARLVSPHEIEVTNETEKKRIQTKNIILATGSESIPLPFAPFDEKKIISSTGALSLPTIPKKMVVVGAGVVGVELASVYNRLGTKVVIIEMLEKICPAMDQAISRTLLQILKKQGLEFHLGSKVAQIQEKGKGLSVTFEEAGKKEEIETDVVLVAVGRRPYTKNLGLGELGIETTPQGFIKVDGNFHTAVPTIYAIGDVIEGAMLAHRASEEGIAVAEIIAGIMPHINYLAIPNVIYTHPEVAALGFTEEEAKQAGMSLKIGSCLFRANSRARSTGEMEGLVKVIGDAESDRLLGIHILGAHASEMIGLGVMGIEKKMTITEMANACYAHPSMSEAIKEALLNALGRAIHF